MFFKNIWIANYIYFGWFRPYWFLVFFGILLTVIFSLISFKKYNIPTDCLYSGIFIIVPFGLMGASLFGKLNIIESFAFYELFAFWLPGMSIHGALIFGLFIGILWFYFESRETEISLWVYADLIVPNILLGQSIGRWGNFFNHEIMGLPTLRESLWWLPSFIRNNMFKWFYDNDSDLNIFYYYPVKAMGKYGESVEPDDFNRVQYFQPIFLYESIMSLVLWFLIVFIIPAIFKFIYLFKFKKKGPKFKKLSLKGLWGKWYFDIKPDPKIIKNLSYKFNLRKFYFKNKISMKFKQKFFLYFKYGWARFKQILKSDSSEIEKLENPNKLLILRCGVKSGLYIVLSNIVRIILESQRELNDLFIKKIIILDYVVISLFILCGIIMIIFAQFICVHKWRKGEWLYEKQY